MPILNSAYQDNFTYLGGRMQQLHFWEHLGHTAEDQTK
ncbi:hypothetical protein CDAR_268691, partial [Caerostris darwini]